MPRRGSTGALMIPMGYGGMAAVGTAPWSSTQPSAARGTSGPTAKVGQHPVRKTGRPAPSEAGRVHSTFLTGFVEAPRGSQSMKFAVKAVIAACTNPSRFIYRHYFCSRFYKTINNEQWQWIRMRLSSISTFLIIILSFPFFFFFDLSACPGGPETPCNSHGYCDDGYTGTGECHCYSGFNGTSCELCLPGRYGSSCRRMSMFHFHTTAHLQSEPFCLWCGFEQQKKCFLLSTLAFLLNISSCRGMMQGLRREEKAVRIEVFLVFCAELLLLHGI